MSFHKRSIQQAVAALSQGGIIAYPTEAVYGLGCDPFNAAAVEQLLQLKRRPIHKGLILIAASIQQVEPILPSLNDKEWDTLRAHWPGPFSFAIACNSLVPDWIRGQHETTVIRVTSHPIAAQLCEAWGGLLVSTSANLAGATPARSALQLRSLRDQIQVVVPGSVGESANPSTIIRLSDGEILRAG